LGVRQRAVVEYVTNAVDSSSGTPQWCSLDEIAGLSVDPGVESPSTTSALSATERECWRRAVRTLDDRGVVEMGYVRSTRTSRGGWSGRAMRRVVAARVPLTVEQKLSELTDRRDQLLEVVRTLPNSEAKGRYYDMAIGLTEQIDALAAT
jgi:hypothetical protein